MYKPIHVTSEIGTLKKVMLKRPGKEVENLSPSIMRRLLFDDIPYLPIIQEEHDRFAEALKNEGIEVVYLEKLAAEAIIAGNIREPFVDQMIEESQVKTTHVKKGLKEYLLSLDTQNMIDKIMSGVRTYEIDIKETSLLHQSDDDHYPFYMDPMPSLYFTRDPSVALGNGLIVNNMTFDARKRESLFMEAIIDHHPDFAGENAVKIWRDRNHVSTIEGGDVLVLNEAVLAIGISERTSAIAVEHLSKELFDKNASFKKIIAIKIPNVREMMHLDTVFTMVDHDKFIIHPGIQEENGQIDMFILEPDALNGGVAIVQTRDIEKVLKEALQLESITLIPCGEGDAVAAPREQWNDGSNTLAIAPGVVVTYNRNAVTNELLRSYGIKVIEIPSSELSRGRGGPRCMTMPLIREEPGKSSFHTLTE